MFSYIQHLGTIQLQIVWNKLFNLLQEINNRFTPSIFGATFRDIDDGDDTTSIMSMVGTVIGDIKATEVSKFFGMVEYFSLPHDVVGFGSPLG